MESERDLIFWLRWVLANTLGEAIGLSVVLLVGFGVLGSVVEGLPAAWPFVISLAAGILLGVFEGFVVGLAQGIVLRRRLPGLPLRSWINATMIGAMLAWGLGMLPSTMMAASAGGTQAAPQGGFAPSEMPEWFTYVMAAGLGLVAGVVLALLQWVVLRSVQGVRLAGLWLPANSAAWLVGMPIVFLGMSSIPANATVVQAIPIVVAATTVAGAAVGAIHGFVLIRVLLRKA